jgi:hypothetical protein
MSPQRHEDTKEEIKEVFKLDSGFYWGEGLVRVSGLYPLSPLIQIVAKV